MAWFQPTEAPLRVPTEKVWAVCPSCKSYIPRPDWVANNNVCPQCNYHGRLSCRERIAQLTDDQTFQETYTDVTWHDHLNFSDATGSYAKKAQKTVEKTGLGESILTGTAKLEGIDIVLGVMDFRFMGGSLGSGTGERICLAAEEALRDRKPLILVCTSGGARMHEGIISLMQMAKTSAAIARLKEAGLPYIAILTDPTTGGVSASYAMLGDINVTEPKTLIGFAGRRVIENTIKQKLPDDFQTAEYTQEHGFIDAIVNRHEMKAWLANVLRYMGF